MRFLKNKKGFTFLELVVTMAIMAILGAMVTGLLSTGLASYKHISTDMDYETQARTAMSLVTVQIRQHDETDAINLTYSPDLTLEFYDDPTATPKTFSPGCRIRFDDDSGVLSSQSFPQMGDPTSAADPVEVAGIHAFSVTRDVDADGTVIFTITIGYGDSRELTETVSLRSAL